MRRQENSGNWKADGVMTDFSDLIKLNPRHSGRKAKELFVLTIEPKSLRNWQHQITPQSGR